MDHDYEYYDQILSRHPQRVKAAQGVNNDHDVQGVDITMFRYSMMCRCANSRPVHVILQLLAVFALING